MNHQIKTIYLIGTEDYWGNAKHNIFYTGLYADSETEAKKYIEEKYNKIGVIKPVLSIQVDNKVYILKDGKKMCNINDVQPESSIAEQLTGVINESKNEMTIILEEIYKQISE